MSTVSHATITPTSTDTDIALHAIVSELAASLHAHVSSFYHWLEAEQVLQLAATHGLNPELVGTLRLRPDQGITGLVAETRKPVSVKNPSKHPRYVHVPRSFEERLQSYLGIPVFLTGRTLAGVLTVQSESARIFTPSEISTVVIAANRITRLLSCSTT